MQVRAIVAAVLIALCVPLAIAQCQDQSSHEFVVADVNLERVGRLSPEQEASIRLRVIGRCFDTSTVSELEQRVREAYQNFGYFRATVFDPVIRVRDESRSPKPVSLTFDVDEGQQFKVSAVQWSGASAFPDEQIWQLTSVRPGEIFDISRVRETLDGVRRLYVSAGFVDVAIVPEVKVESLTRVKVSFLVNNGKRSNLD